MRATLLFSVLALNLLALNFSHADEAPDYVPADEELTERREELTVTKKKTTVYRRWESESEYDYDFEDREIPFCGYCTVEIYRDGYMTILIDDWYPVYEAYGHRKLRRALWQLIADGRCRNDDELIHRYGLLRGELRPVYRGPVFQPRPWVRRGFYPQYRSYPAPAFLRPYRR